MYGPARNLEEAVSEAEIRGRKGEMTTEKPNRLAANYSRKLAELEALKKSLLHLFFSGTL